MSRRARLVSLPREHGAWLTLLGALTVGLALAPATGRGAASGVALCLTVAFVVRGPLDELAVARRARGDRVALAALGLLALAGTALAARAGMAGALTGASLIIAGSSASAVARRAKVHRNPPFEVASMAALGCGALPIALAGGAPMAQSLFASAVLGLHAAIAVPLVRTELRPRERAFGRGAEAASLVALVAAATCLAGLGHAWTAVALLPRAAQVASRRFGLMMPRNPTLVGVRESVLLALCALIVVAMS